MAGIELNNLSQNRNSNHSSSVSSLTLGKSEFNQIRDNNVSAANTQHSFNDSAATLSGDQPFVLLVGEEIIIKEDNVKLANYQGSDRNSIGTLYITNYRLYFYSQHHDNKVAHSNFYVDPSHVIIDMPLGSISKVEKFGGAARGSEKYGLEILCKDFRGIRLQIRKSKNDDSSLRKSLFDHLQRFAFPVTYQDGIENLFAFTHRASLGLAIPTESDGWHVYDPVGELERLGVPNQNWRMFEENANYTLSDTYPAVMAVPASIKKEVIVQVAKYRSKGRLPALSWINRETQASITRCSQPTTGVGGRRCEADEQFIRAIREANPRTTGIWVADARPRANAIANKAKGGGFESVDAYKGMELVFLDIHNIHVMRESLRKVRELCWPRLEEARWLSGLENTRWLEHIRQVLAGAARIAHKVDSDKTSVLVHCSDGWDRTSQLTSIAMLLLDPYYRTLRGFQVLVEKEWLAFGHKFSQRIGHGEDKHSDPERSPVFLQFIDCVWQLTQTFKHCFEFNEQFLLIVLDALYSCRFGTFLASSERERELLRLRSSTVSLWTVVNSERKRFLNPLYNRNMTQVLKPKPTLRSLGLWAAYYLRWNQTLRRQEPIDERLMQLIDLRDQLVLRVEELLRLESSAAVHFSENCNSNLPEQEDQEDVIVPTSYYPNPPRRPPPPVLSSKT